MTVKPENVYALVVGIEKYQAGSAWDLNGPAKDALKFANWLLARDVKPEQIQLFLSPLTQNEGILAEANSKGLTFVPATHDQIDSAIRYKLTNESSRGDLLYVFWGGHGIVTKTDSTTRRLLFADTDDINKWNLNFNSLVEALSTFAHNSGFKQQNFLIDACANAYYNGLYQTTQAGLADSRFGTTGERGKADQFVLFASAEYEVATNESDIGTGRFSRAVLDELQGQSLMPEMREFVERVRVNLHNKQKLEVVYWLYEYRGNKEVNDKTNLVGGKVQSVPDSVSPTTVQLQMPKELDSKAFSQFSEALGSAFLDQESLALMVRKALNKPLNVISQNDSNYEVTIDKLIAWAEANGRLQDLMEGALHRNPKNPKLLALARTWGQK